MNNYSSSQARANTANIQNDVEQVTGQPIRVYPFKIVSGLNYLSNRGLSGIGTNPGNTYPNQEQGTTTNIDYGAYTDLSLIYSGNRPIIAYWFGVMSATMNADGTITENINATQDENGNWVPNMFSNPLTALARDSSKNDATQWKDMEQQNPWKNVGVIDYSFAPNHTYTHQLDNVECGIYEMVYNYSCISNEWNPSFQEINEFIYFIIDIRYPCPIALRISGVSPHYRPDGVFQWADIQFQSINQYFNTSSYSILSYVKFGAINDAYCFPKEIIVDGELKTIINPNFLLASQAGVDSVCIKNNSLVAHLGTLIYGHPYVPFQEQNGVLTRTNEADRYLLPLSFQAPINDNIVSKHSLVHSSYSLAMNMVVVSEQLWGSWRQTKEIYNPIQNFTYQGGLAFAGGDDSNNALYAAINNILNPGNTSDLTSQINTAIAPNQTAFSNWGSGNLQVVMFSNKKNWSLDILQTQSWQPIGSTTTGTGFYLYGANVNTIGTWDFRFTHLTSAVPAADWAVYLANGVNDAITAAADIFSAGYTPNTQQTSEIGLLSSLSNGALAQGDFVQPNVAFVLNSMSMKNVHMLEVNYRDGIVYTNTNRGHGGFLNMIANWMSGIADKIIGYTPGQVQFFMNTAARSYNLFIPSSLLPLFQAYLDPSGNNYNAIPLDIFNNSYDNNTAVGQLQYMSGLQFSLTDTYYGLNYTEIAIFDIPSYQLLTTQYWGKLPKDSKQLPTNLNGSSSLSVDTLTLSSSASGYVNIPWNSFAFFVQPAANVNGSSFVIDEINVKQLGQSNLHITYLKNNPNGKLITVGEEWVANNAKVMKNNAYIDNDFDYYVYDEYNTTFASNVSPYIALEYAPLAANPVSTSAVPTYTLPKGQSRGTYGLDANATIKGVSFASNTTHWHNDLKDYYKNKFTANLQGNQNYKDYNVKTNAIGVETINGWTCPIGEWFTSAWSYGFGWGAAENSNYWTWENGGSMNDTTYLNQCQQAPKNVSKGYLTGTELISNCLLMNFSIIANQEGPSYDGQCCEITDTVYYETIHLVFNIEYLITQTLHQWEYSANTSYTNYYCLVPENYTDDDINNIPIPSNLPTNKNFVLIYDGTNTHMLSFGAATPIKNWNLYGYLQQSFPSNNDQVNTNGTGNYGPNNVSGIGLYNTTTFLNGGGCVNMLCVEQPGLNGTSPYNEVDFTDYDGNWYESSSTVGGADSGTPQIQLWGCGTGKPFPTSATTIYGGKTFKLVMIVLK